MSGEVEPKWIGACMKPYIDGDVWQCWLRAGHDGTCAEANVDRRRVPVDHDALLARLARAEATIERVRTVTVELETERPSSGAWRGAYRNNARRLRAALADQGGQS